MSAPPIDFQIMDIWQVARFPSPWPGSYYEQMKSLITGHIVGESYCPKDAEISYTASYKADRIPAALLLLLEKYQEQSVNYGKFTSLGLAKIDPLSYTYEIEHTWLSKDLKIPTTLILHGAYPTSWNSGRCWGKIAVERVEFLQP